MNALTPKEQSQRKALWKLYQNAAALNGRCLLHDFGYDPYKAQYLRRAGYARLMRKGGLGVAGYVQVTLRGRNAIWRTFGKWLTDEMCVDYVAQLAESEDSDAIRD